MVVPRYFLQKTAANEISAAIMVGGSKTNELLDAQLILP